MEWLTSLAHTLLSTLDDVLPIALVIFGFQLFDDLVPIRHKNTI